MASTPTTVTTFDGSVIPATLSGVTAHLWAADATGTYRTPADLKAEWTAAYAAMLAGNGSLLNPLLRLEGNAEAVIEFTAAAKLSATSQANLRQDLQREFDAIYAAMTLNQAAYGIDPALQFNAYTYLKLEETLQADERLKELGYQGHGVNSPPAIRYNGFTTDFQNKVDGKTFFVGGGPGTGELAIANFLDDDVLSHAPYPVVMHNGVLTQLNQNGTLEDPLTDVLEAVNEFTYTRILVASDFSTNKAAVGPMVLDPHALAAPAPPVAGPGQILTFDGTPISATITGITAHGWVADATGTFHTASDLKTEWLINYATMLQGRGDQLSPLQRLEGNAEAVMEYTGAGRLTLMAQASLREDLQREFDAIDAAMRMNQVLYGIDPLRQFNAYTYLKLEETLQGDERLKELGYQGHGVNNPASVRYNGFTTDFQNRTDNTTFYVGGGPGNGEKAIANFLDDDLLSHAPFPVVMHNGVLTQLNQNGTLEDQLTEVLEAVNQNTYLRVLVGSDFSTSATAVGQVVLVPNARTAPDQAAAPAGLDQAADPAYLYATHPEIAATGADPVLAYDQTGWRSGWNPSGFFDTGLYLAQNPDVRAAGVDPLQHYEAFGWQEGRQASLLFDGGKYLAANADVSAAGANPLVHYMQFGRAEGRMAFLTGGTSAADALVDAAYYDRQLGASLIPAGTPAAQQAAWSYDGAGWQQGLNPDAWFDTRYYLAHNADVAAAHVNPLQHYETFGWHEGRDPSAQFSTNRYLAAYADVRAAGVDPLLHYVMFGQAEGRTAFTA